MSSSRLFATILLCAFASGSALGQNQAKATSTTQQQTASAPSSNAPSNLSTVKGTGTANFIPIWTSATTQGNSLLSQSSGNVTTSAGITAASFSGSGAGLTGVNAAELSGIGPSGFAQLGASTNTFSGTISAATVSSTNTYQIGGFTVLSSPLSNNIFLGVGAGNQNVTGTFNTGVGVDSLSADTTGTENTATGAGALGSNFDGSQNTADGYKALFGNSHGTQNTASGYLALGGNTTGSSNTGDGFETLSSNTIGTSNTASGVFALSALNPTASGTGSVNTAVGANAGQNLTTGIANTMLGAFAGDNLKTNESTNIDIGNQGVTGDGSTAGNTGVIRIGTDVSQDPTCFIGCQTSTYIAAVNGVTIAGGGAVLINSSGQLGTIVSSRRYKEDIHDMAAASDGLLRLRPVTFRYKKSDPDGSKPIQYGLIAEEVAQVYPDLVVRGKDGQPDTVQYYKLDAMLLNEVQKLSRQHASDQEEVAKLQLEVAQQQAAMKQLLNDVRAIQAKLGKGHQVRTSTRIPDQD